LNIILFGFKRCGKTTFGQKLAEKMHCSFIDTDHVVESLYEAKTGLHLSCPKIYEKIGERSFRLLEREAALSLQEVHSSVIAVGGGSMLDPLVGAFLDQIGTLVYLKLHKETVKKRILSDGLPAYIDPKRPEDSFEEEYEKRVERFERLAVETVDMEGKNESEVLTSLIQIYQKIKGTQLGEQ
jgi:shikimate kinase